MAPGPPEVDWEALRRAAAAAARRAYAPYSSYPVGAAGLVDDGAGTVISGCNVENVSYGLALCAECGLVSALHAGGHAGRLVAVAVCGPDGHDIPPCGRCRQLLLEAGGPDLQVNERPMRDWLPVAFDIDDLGS
ncbi:MAG: cytidine deaminase [Acidimicrobiales bacterium]